MMLRTATTTVVICWMAARFLLHWHPSQPLSWGRVLAGWLVAGLILGVVWASP